MEMGSARVTPGNPSVAGNGETLPSTLTPGRSAGKAGTIRTTHFLRDGVVRFSGDRRPLAAYLLILTFHVRPEGD